jgi:hypothetical protein
MADDQLGPDIFSDVPPEAPGAEKPDYANMPWSQVGKMAVGNLKSSAINAVTSIPQAIYHYPETLGALKQIGTGIASKAEGLVSEQDPQKKAQDEAVLNAAVEPFTSVAGFKKALAEDPFSVASVAAIPFTGGAAGLARGAELVGEAGTLGRTLGAASKVAKTAATAMDPTQAMLSGLEVAGRKIPKIQALATGKPSYVFEKAYGAGKTSGDDIKNAFLQYYHGEGDPVDLANSTKKAIDKIRDDEIKAWASDKQNLAIVQTPVPEQKIIDAMDRAHNEIAAQNNPVIFKEAKDFMREVDNKIMYHLMQPVGSPERSILGMDKLKQDLYDLSQLPQTPTAKRAVDEVYHAVIDSLKEASPEYAELMDRYKNIKSELNDIASVTGAGGRASATTQMGKSIRAAKSTNGQNLLERLAEVDPTIPYKIAGASLHGQVPSGFFPKAAELGTGLAFHAPNIYRALQSGDVIEVAKSLAPLAIQGVVQSPAAMGAVSYGAGRAGKILAPVAKPAKKTIEAGGSAAATNIERVKGETFADPSMFSDVPPELEGEPMEVTVPLKPQVPTGQASGGRIGRKSGGKVIGNSLSQEVERTRKELSQKTAQMLSMPDDAIVTALKIAQSN